MPQNHRKMDKPWGLAATKDVRPFSKSNRKKFVLRDTTNRRRGANTKIHQSDAVQERKAELEQLRQKSLTTDIATRLRNAEAPTSPDKFKEHQKFFQKLEKSKLREAKTYVNQFQTDGNKINDFTKQRRRSLQLEKTKQKEAKSHLKNHRADGNKLNIFTEQRRKSLQLEKNKVQEAKNYTNNFRTGGNEHIRFIERQRKNLLQEQTKLQVGKTHLNSYRSKCNELLISGCHRRNSTGSKPSRAPWNSPLKSTIAIPKSHFKENNKFKSNGAEQTKKKNLSLQEPSEHKSQPEPLHKFKELDAGKVVQGPDRKQVKDSPTVHFHESRDSSSTKEEDCLEIDKESPRLERAIAQEIQVFQNDTHDNNINLDSPVTGGENDVEHEGCNSSGNLRSKVLQKEEEVMAIKLGQSDNDENFEANQNTIPRPQSPRNFDKQIDDNILDTNESNNIECCDKEISVQCDDDDNDDEANFDPYYSDEDENPFRIRNHAEEIADISKPMKEKDCFICSIM